VERALLEKESDAIIDRVRPGSILELGSGSSKKTTFLLDACERKECHSLYLPLDVCEEMVLGAGKWLLEKYDWVDVGALVGDFCKGFKQLPSSEGSRLFVFLGGTIGNFEKDLAKRFLRDVRLNMNENDWLLLGADRVKDEGVLNAAYNDKRGYTAAFNLNMLEVINREFHANFVLKRFEHHAWFNSKKSRIEMHLKCNEDHEVYIRDLGMKVQFKKGETILTEISRKFTPESLENLLEGTGFQIDQHFEAEDGYFSLVLVRPF
jgi:L-histidine N-alpha-methyltransferase